MANPLYNLLMGGTQQNNLQPVSSGPRFMNPVQKVNYILQAMQNPAAFVKQHFPDIPSEIQNNPNQILGYLQRTRGISNQDIQKAQQDAAQIRNQSVYGVGSIK